MGHQRRRLRGAAPRMATLRCSACLRVLEPTAFSGAQRKKKAAVRRCNDCTTTESLTPRDIPQSCRKRWYELELAGSSPAPRCSHTATCVRWRLYVIGGGAIVESPPHSGPVQFTHFNDVPVLDMRTLRWSIGLPSSDFPARRGHSAVLHEPSDRVLVFGGTNGGTGQAGCMNDVWANGAGHTTTRTCTPID